VSHEEQKYARKVNFASVYAAINERNRSMKTKLIAAAFLLNALFVVSAEAKLVRVYYPEGHYLGCGTPAADGSGIWSYDPRVSEADCHDRVAHQPQVSGYVSAAQMKGFESLASKTFPPGLLPGTTTSADAKATPVGTGVVFRVSDWLAFDASVAAGHGSTSRTSRYEGAIIVTTRATADFRVFTGALSARLYPFHCSRIEPFFSAGVRGVELRPQSGSTSVGQFRSTLNGSALDSVSAVDFSPGLGIDAAVTPHVGVTLSGDHSFRSGWRAALAVTYKIPPLNPLICNHARWPCDSPWPPTGTCPYAGCEPFPFAYPGQMHNEALDAVLATIQSAAALPGMHRTKQDLRNLIETSVHQFARTHGLDGGLPAKGGALNPNQQAYVNEISQLVSNAPDNQSLDDAFINLSKRAVRELGPASAQPVVIAASVGSASSDYWQYRSPIWEDALAHYFNSDAKPVATSRFSWKKLLIADALGALGGALSGGGLVGAIVGGAIDSAENAADQLGDEPARVASVPLSCVFRGGRFCDKDGYQCLVMFPPDEPPFLSNAHPIEGRASIAGGTLRYELASATPIGASAIPLTSESSLPQSAARDLGYQSVTILPGQYVVDPHIGTFGGIDFNIRTTPIAINGLALPSRTELVKRVAASAGGSPTNLTAALEAAGAPAHLMNFNLATLDDLTPFGLGSAVYVPVQVSDREGGRKSIYFLFPGEEVLTGIYASCSGLALKYVKRTSGNGVPAKVGDGYTTRLTSLDGASILHGEGALQSFDAQNGRGVVNYTMNGAGSDPTAITIVITEEISELWSCFKSTTTVVINK
jgi:hypothetical protein